MQESGYCVKKEQQTGLLRFAKKFAAYVFVLPLMVILCPFTVFGNWLGVTYYKLRRW